MRLVNAYAYSNSARASRVELEAESYEEVDCPKERCYMYGRQELHSYDSTLFPYPYGVFFTHHIWLSGASPGRRSY
jgi:hypothetical protein